ncbi:MAG: enoyl-CoA hydratase [Desulfatibacillaceae bacterium]|nr:enoyl-CoA hydratase [Desulfatibacillaceae bacterium]
MEELVLAQKQGQVLVLTLNRPEMRNAFNFEMLRALAGQVDKVRFDSDVRCIIITGSGDKAFCAGADLKERATLSEVQVREFIFTIRNLFTSIENLPKPVIAAINGAAFGGGTELALACDIRIAADSAVMGLTETRLAIIPGAGGTQRLPRIIGRGLAKELIFTGRTVKMDEALNIGLINRAVEPEKLMESALEMAQQICENGPIAVTQAKYAINQGLETDISTGLAIESNAYWLTIPTQDRLEGLASFREKRKPQYKGK